MKLLSYRHLLHLEQQSIHCHETQVKTTIIHEQSLITVHNLYTTTSPVHQSLSLSNDKFHRHIANFISQRFVILPTNFFRSHSRRSGGGTKQSTTRTSPECERHSQRLAIGPGIRCRVVDGSERRTERRTSNVESGGEGSTGGEGRGD
jgi:hypothetical protein